MHFVGAATKNFGTSLSHKLLFSNLFFSNFKKILDLFSVKTCSLSSPVDVLLDQYNYYYGNYARLTKSGTTTLSAPQSQR